MKTENWLGNEIRFVDVDGEWWAVAEDVAKALDYSRSRNMVRMLDDDEKGAHNVSTLGGVQKVTIISETGIYECILKSKRKEAKEFKRWVKDVLKELRKQSGLEGFEVFRMLDKEHQKQQMEILRNAYDEPHKANYIKANTLANKATSNYYGFSKMIKKEDMTPEMLVTREKILEDAVKLLEMQEQFGLEHVSQMLYKKWCKE